MGSGGPSVYSPHLDVLPHLPYLRLKMVYTVTIFNGRYRRYRSSAIPNFVSCMSREGSVSGRTTLAFVHPMPRPTFSINWFEHRPGVYAWSEECHHSAIPTFAGYVKIRGDGPTYIYKHPTAGYVYGCFDHGAGRNFYGQHTLTIVEL